MEDNVTHLFINAIIAIPDKALIAMSSIQITIPDERLQQLQDIAANLNVSIEELVLMSVEQYLTQSELSFNDATAYVLHKNAELYRRLA
ncbi:DNA-binding protein [Moorena sp. SIO3I8]|nr:DNA-binding protein [Moorena sp. SIO3I8]